ncbi:MAG: response regulator transcription factor [Acidobacteriota bacterium]|nr:response regulator transcription factor [Acidobacteriota bacterium]
MSDRIRLVIADDHPLLREGLRRIIEQEIDLQVLAEAGDGVAALENIIALEPQIAILDVDMPKLNGFEVIRALNEKRVDVSVIMLTVHREEEFFDEALRLGAKGYVLKDSAVTDIVIGIRAVAAGQNYASPALTSYLFKPRRAAHAKPSGFETLTPTERRVLQLIAEYKTSNQIAEELFISPHTVKTHRKNICAKLNLEGSHALMKFALEHKTTL